jgi:hypothetical protein
MVDGGSPFALWREMLMTKPSRKCGWLLAIVLSPACSDASRSDETPRETDDAGQLFPILPADCDVLPPSTSMGVGPIVKLADLSKRIRAVGDTVYLHRVDGIYAVNVPEGTPSLFVPDPMGTLSTGATVPLPFRDFWIDETSFIGAVSGVLFSAPATGGSATRLPGYNPPSPSEVGDGFYARAGDNVYRTTFLSPSGYGIERHSLSGGMPSEFVRFSARNLQKIIAGGNSIYYVDRADGDAESAESIFAAALDTGTSSAVARGLRFPTLLGFDRDLYLTDTSTPAGQVFRLRADHELEKLTTPYNVIVPMEISFTTLRGIGYFTAVAAYHLPDDRRVERRDVVMQVRPDSSTVEVVRCLPNPATSPTTPRERMTTQVIDLTAGDSAVYLARSIRDDRNDTWEDQILEVAR